MTPDNWAKIEEIFQEALDLPREARASFIREKCADDANLQSEVEKLVARYEKEETFLESPAWTDSQFLQASLKQQIASSLENQLPAASGSQPLIGERIGVYKLVKELGNGGMGAVFLATRDDGEFQQQVAIKLIKRGMDTEFIVKRFRHERQILATLTHPNIARLLDGGTTENDLPYIVMEYIEGETFIKFAKSKNLNLRQKLKLFLQVCAAISYAHKRKIIHRDIKPSNIIVTVDDEEPKLLDFGIAKILDPDWSHDSVLQTGTQMRLMTPEYASPEQVRGENVTEASDQYSLGVLLYELITGKRPYKFSSRAPHEIARIICEEIPSEPSSGNFNKIITGDFEIKDEAELGRRLDRIVLKSLRKAPVERYASVKDFADDIERFLQNQPVHAEAFSDAREVFGKTENKENQLPNQKSIAVLPLKMRYASSEETPTGGSYLSVGLADALITRLSNVKQLIVRPTSSVLKFAESDVDSFAAGRQLSVAYVLDGTILQTETQIRVTIQLLNVAENSIVWAERFDEELTDVLTLEDKISKKVGNSLIPQLSTGDREKLARRGTDNPKAYEAYLRGRFYRNMFTEASLKKAFAAYQEAISYDPNYALAYIAIADYYIWLSVYGILPPKECYLPAKAATLRAIELDDELTEAYASLAFIEVRSDYDWVEAEKNAVRAVELNPNYPVARLWYSYLLISLGRTDEGIIQAKRAIELDPSTFHNYLVLSLNYYFARRYAEAVAQVNANVENFPALAIAYQIQSWVLREGGSTKDSVAAAKRGVEISGDSLFLLLTYAQALAADNQRAEAEKVLQQVFEIGKNQYVSYYQVAIVYVYLNENQKALDALDKAYEDREGWLIWLAGEPSLDRLRAEPRFIKLRQKVENQQNQPASEKIDSSPEMPGQKSIAVLPFKILKTPDDSSEIGDTSFLSLGLTDALITRLSNVRRFVVRPTSSVLRFENGDVESLAAGRELKVSYVLDGNILHSDKKIRVSVQLLDVDNNLTVWAERYDEDFTDVLEVENKLSAKVAASLVPQLSGEEKNLLEKPSTDNLEAFEAYLRGRFHWNTFTDEGFRNAIYFYRKAIEIDPDYALAYAAIADYYVLLGVYNVLPVNQFYPPAKEAALHAIRLDNKLSEAYTALGLTQLYGEFNWQESEKSFQRGIELNPNSAGAYLWYTHNLYPQKRFAEGQKLIERAFELDPLSFQVNNHLAWHYYHTGEVEMALQRIDEVIRDFPTISHSYFGKANFLNLAGRPDEALIEIKRAMELSKDSLFAIYGLAQTYALAGKRREAEELIEKTRNQEGKEFYSLYQTALVYSCLNDKDKAFEYLERSLHESETLLIWLAIQPFFENLRNDERYFQILERMNHPLAKAKRAAGKLSPVAQNLNQEDSQITAPHISKAGNFKYILAAGAALLIIFLLIFLLYQ